MLEIIRNIILVIAIHFVVDAVAQPQCVVAFYNVENLMDIEDDPSALDEDMLPLADKNWDHEKYCKKLRDIAHVVSDLGNKHDVPALLGLAEVENRTVLKDLVKECRNVGIEYEFCHYDSSDERGVDVALLYRRDLFEIQRSRAITPKLDNPTRDILAVWGNLCGEDVFLAVVHFPSRIGGVKFTEHRRVECCNQLRELIDSVKREEPHRRIIVRGDMNDNPRDKSVRDVRGAERNSVNALASGLYNPFAKILRRAYRGSSVYQGEWNLYDNIILSWDFLSGEGLQLSGRGAIFKQNYLLDKKHHPLPTYKGVEYCSGVSDHLPVYVVLQ